MTSIRREAKRTKGAKYPSECVDHVPLFRWLKGLGWRNETGLRIGRFGCTGKGLYSRKPLAEADCLIALPFEALIGLNVLERDEHFRGMFDESAVLERAQSLEKLPFQALLAVYLCVTESAHFDTFTT